MSTNWVVSDSSTPPPAASDWQVSDSPTPPNGAPAAKPTGPTWGSSPEDVASTVGEHLKGLVTGPIQAVTHPYDTFVKPTVDAGGRAVSQFKQGRYADAARSAESAIPVVGPWADSIENEVGQKGAVAGLAGLATDVLAPKVAGAAVGKLPNAMQDSATGIINRTVGSRKSDFARGANPGRGYLDNSMGPSTSMGSIAEKATDAKNAVGGALADAYDQASQSGKLIPADDIRKAIHPIIDEAKRKASGPGVMANPDAYDDLKSSFEPMLQQADANGGMTPSELWKVRRNISDSLNWGDQTKATMTRTQQRVSGALGGLLEDAVPEVKDLNQHYQDLGKLAGRAKERAATHSSTLTNMAVKGGLTGAGALLGSGTPIGPLGGAAVGAALNSIPVKTAVASGLNAGSRFLRPAAPVIRAGAPAATLGAVTGNAQEGQVPEDEQDQSHEDHILHETRTQDGKSASSAQVPSEVEALLHRTGAQVTNKEAPTSKSVASVDPDQPNTINIDDMERFNKDANARNQTISHEAVHNWHQNLPPAIQKMIPLDNPKDLYGKDNTGYEQDDLKNMRGLGVKLWNLPREKAAAVIQTYAHLGGDNAPRAVQEVYKPWAQDMVTSPLSSVQPTAADAQGLDTAARPPTAMHETHVLGENGEDDTTASLNNIPAFEKPYAATTTLQGGADPTAIAHYESPDDLDSDPQKIRHRILVDDPSQFTQPVLNHEMVHAVQRVQQARSSQAGLEGEINKPIPWGMSDEDAYDYGGPEGLASMRAKGQTIANLNREQQARLVEDYTRSIDSIRKNTMPSNPGDSKAIQKANGQINSQMLQKYDQLNSIYGPFIRELAEMARTQPGIDTNPRPPGPPPSPITGSMKPLDEMGGRTINTAASYNTKMHETHILGEEKPAKEKSSESVPRGAKHAAGDVVGYDSEDGLPIIKRKSGEAKEPAAKPEKEDTPDGKRDILHASKDREELVADGKAHAPHLEAGLQAAADSVPGAKLEGVRSEKDPQRLDEKIKREGQPVETVPDVLAGRISVDSDDAHKEVVDDIKKHATVVRDKDEFKKGDSRFGFHAHKLQVKVSPKMSAEVQVVPKEVAANDKKQHPVYEKAREADLDGDTEKADALAQKSKAMNDEAKSRFDRRNKEKDDVSGGDSSKRADSKGLHGVSSKGRDLGDDAKGDVQNTHRVGDRVTLPNGKAATVAYAPSKGAQLPTYRFKGEDGTTTTMRASEAHAKVKKAPDDESGSIAVDLDQTLAHSDSGGSRMHIGAPEPAMVDRIKKDLAAGKQVKIFTARVANDPTGKVREAIQAWSKKHLGVALDVTDKKLPGTGVILDDKAKQVKNDKVMA